MITKFKLYLEDVLMSDIIKYNGNDENINRHINQTFREDDKLLDVIILDVPEHKIIKLEWNHKETHSIIKRIKERTNFKSIIVFNEYLTSIFNKLFTEYYDEITRKYRKYNIYIVEKNISIICIIPHNLLYNIDSSIQILSIINGLDSDVNKIIEIE